MSLQNELILELSLRKCKSASPISQKRNKLNLQTNALRTYAND